MQFLFCNLNVDLIEKVALIVMLFIIEESTMKIDDKVVNVRLHAYRCMTPIFSAMKNKLKKELKSASLVNTPMI